MTEYWDVFMEEGITIKRDSVESRFSLKSFRKFYKTILPNLDSGNSSFTIFSDEPDSSKGMSSHRMTIDICLKICNTNGFVYAGLTT
jgi:hypothetical protein